MGYQQDNVIIGTSSNPSCFNYVFQTNLTSNAMKENQLLPFISRRQYCLPDQLPKQILAGGRPGRKTSLSQLPTQPFQ